ncbi:MAG TPA: ATP-binding protein [Candidatus Dormibacteraeota bacterium]|nr:ATP-binding protein [Candidatus Dormibacteraeota bacterium]
MGQGYVSWTRVLVRRATPFAAIAAVFAVQALAAAPPVIAFPLYLAVVLVVALQQDLAESLAVAAAGAVALVIQADDLAPDILLGAVLIGVALSMGWLTVRTRAANLLTQRRLDDLTAAAQALRTTFESVDVGLGLSDFDGRFVQVNSALARLVDRTQDSLVGAGVAEIVDGEDREAIVDALAMLRRGDVSRWRGLLAHGRTLSVSLARVPDRQVLVVQASDATDEVRVNALRDCAAAVHQIVLDSAGVDQAMPALLEAFRHHLGWTATRYWSSRAIAVTERNELVTRVWQSGVLAAEVQAEHSSVAVPVIDAGEVAGVIELTANETKPLKDDDVAMLTMAGVEIGQFLRRSEITTALRRSEADHRAIFERSPIGIARIGGDGELVEANPALLHMLEHDAETMRNTAWPDMMRAYDQAATRHGKAMFLAGITDGSSVQVRAATGGGKWLWLQLTATSIPDANGRPEHVLLMIEDVTAVRETSDKLAEALEAQRAAIANLEKHDQTKSEFLSIVSHEFRTALTGIQGFSELIRDGGLEPDEVRAYGGYIFNDADRVNRLIGDMLDLDRMESGRMTMRATDVDINDILMESIARASSSTVTVEFKSDLDPRLPIVAGDRDRLIQVVSNLVNNAVKYSPEGGTVTLTSRVEGRYALISITDTGIGIPADEIAHVFERFRRVRSGAAQSIPGTGLGLTIVKQIVEMHGGKIWVESAVGHGSSFHFTIPLAPEGAAALHLRHG